MVGFKRQITNGFHMLDYNQLGFYSSNFDRAAHLRDKRNGSMPSANAKTMILWRGKPLLDQNDFAVIYVGAEHPILSESKTPPIFLGHADNMDYFAHDISSWQPEEFDDSQEGVFLDDQTEHHPSMPPHYRFNDLRMVMTSLSPEDGELAATAKAMFSWHRSHQFCATCGIKSVQSQAGWQRDCPACETPHYPRTDPVVIMLITDGNKTLLGRSPHWPEQMYSCLAGFLEPGETIEAAVAREVKEETDIDIGPVKYIASQPWPYPSSMMIGCIAPATSTRITIDPNELEDAKWVTKETLVKAYSGSDAGINPARQGSIAGFLIRNWVEGTLDS
jgi:NAD+ diphosphatase